MFCQECIWFPEDHFKDCFSFSIWFFFFHFSYCIDIFSLLCVSWSQWKDWQGDFSSLWLLPGLINLQSWIPGTGYANNSLSLNFWFSSFLEKVVQNLFLPRGFGVRKKHTHTSRNRGWICHGIVVRYGNNVVNFCGCLNWLRIGFMFYTYILHQEDFLVTWIAGTHKLQRIKRVLFIIHVLFFTLKTQTNLFKLGISDSTLNIRFRLLLIWVALICVSAISAYLSLVAC